MLDIGSSSLRAGYAGDDTPKAIVPTAFGYLEEPAPSNGDVAMSEAGAPEGEQPQPPKPRVKLYIGQNGPSLWRSGMQVGNPMHDGLSSFSFLKNPACSLTTAGVISPKLRLHSSSHQPWLQRRHALRSLPTPCARYRSPLEYACKPGTYGRNHV